MNAHTLNSMRSEALVLHVVYDDAAKSYAIALYDVTKNAYVGALSYSQRMREGRQPGVKWSSTFPLADLKKHEWLDLPCHIILKNT